MLSSLADSVSDEQGSDRYDLWLSRAARTTALAVGTGVVVYEVWRGGNIEFALMAVGMMGLPFGKTIDNFLSWVASLRTDSTTDNRSKNPSKK